MSLAVVGVSHRTAPVEVRERFVVDAQASAAALRHLATIGCTEAVLLSTCNRTELYMRAAESNGAAVTGARFLSEHAGLGLALPVQLPLGWWLVRAVGSDGLLLAWAVGMMGRIGVLVVAAWIVAPLAGVPLGPLLITLAAVLLALLGVEAAVLTHRVRHDGVR
jgi:hypothetical protein